MSHPHPRPVTALLYRARKTTTAARSRGYRVLCSRFPVRFARDPLHTGFPLVSLLPASAATGGRRLPHPKRPGYRTNGEFDDPSGGSESARVPPDTTRYSNADLGSGEARREPTDTAVIHLAAAFRDSLTFLRIGPFAFRETPRCGPADSARGRSSCSRQDVTPSIAGGRLFRRIRSCSTYIIECV